MAFCLVVVVVPVAVVEEEGPLGCEVNFCFGAFTDVAPGVEEHHKGVGENG